LACLSLVSCDDKKNENTLVVAVSADYPPFEFYKDGKIVGFEIDLIKAIAKELNKEVVIKDMSFDSIIGALHSGRIDLAISNIAITNERKEKVDFTIPYYKTLSVMLVDSRSSVSKPEDLAGQTIGTQTGTPYEKMIKEEWQKVVPNLSLRSLAKVPDLIQDFKSERLSAIVLGFSEAESIIKAHPNFKIIPMSATEADCAIALPPGSLLTGKINQILQRMETDGTLKKIQDTWLHTTE